MRALVSLAGVLALLALPGVAVAARGDVKAQLAQATTGGNQPPPLSDEPPGEDGQDPADDGGDEPSSQSGRRDRQARSGDELANTGWEPGLLALLGTGLLASGFGLRLQAQLRD